MVSSASKKVPKKLQYTYLKMFISDLVQSIVIIMIGMLLLARLSQEHSKT